MFLNFTELPHRNEIFINVNDIVTAEELTTDSIAHLYKEFLWYTGEDLKNLPENVMRLTLHTGETRYVESHPTHFKEMIANLK